MNFLKKYWTHIISLSFLTYCDVLFIIIMNNIEKFDSLNLGIIFFFLGIELLFVIGVWAEIIIYMIHAIRHKEIKNNAICAVLIYLLNVIYIPCYCLKHVSKDENYKIKNTIYIIATTILYVILCILIVKIELSY